MEDTHEKLLLADAAVTEASLALKEARRHAVTQRIADALALLATATAALAEAEFALRAAMMNIPVSSGGDEATGRLDMSDPAVTGIPRGVPRKFNL